MNSADAWLVYQLLKDYHETAKHLKALRRLRLGHVPPSDQDVETHRMAATGWFNQVATLYLRNLIDEKTFRLVASPQAARLWVEYVADLDHAVRVAAGGSTDMPMVERFWREYAEGRLMTLQFVLSAPSMHSEPAGVQ